MFSMISISPHLGQLTVAMSVPNIQKAGHIPCRNFDASFKAAIGLTEKPLRLEPGGGVVARNAVGARDVLFLRSDDEIAGLNLRILRPIRIALEFVVAPAFAPGVVSPFRGVRSGAVSAVEFVGPSEVPTLCGRRLQRGASTTTQR